MVQVLRGTIRMLVRRCSLKQKPICVFGINMALQGVMDQHKHEESIENPREEVPSDANAKKDNLKKLLYNEFLMNDLGA